ncbi:LysR family transcriptional regulator [Bacillus sp. B190/17]|uniref:LysR family transcriptional regulator n=1 Tax=Bacillus lumedeiriae TaxID=3058829 RepID=A0ABW8I736_9BACI
MDIRHLHYFITLAEQTTFTQAAFVLHISQPSLSATIKKLENELGLILLDRSSREIRLTREGEILYHEAKKLVDHFGYVWEEMRRVKEQGPPELSVGLIESTKHWIPKILSRFKMEYKDVRIKLMDVLSLEDVEKALSNFEIHLAITNQYTDSEEIEMIPIYEEKLIALLPEDHLLKDHAYLTVRDLEGEALIICKEGFQTRTDTLNTFRTAEIRPNIQFEIERFEMACRLVEEGLGITVLPENYVKYSIKPNFLMKPIEDSNLSRTVYLAFDKNRYLPPLVLDFISLVKEFFDHRARPLT